MNHIVIKLPQLHASQQKIAKSKTRFRVLACGRRWGKTRLGAVLSIKCALEGGRSWWIAPNYKQANVGWRLIRHLAVQVGYAEIRQSDRSVFFPFGGEVSVRSADNPDSLRGEGLDFVVLDECAFMKEEAWREALRPALSDRLGRAMFISTPKGRGWFWRAWLQCQDDKQSEWQGWQLPTADNPFIKASEIEAARLGLPDRTFRQEYLAEFIDDAGGVFRGVAAAATAQGQDKATPGHQYVFGVDWAQQHDFTAITVMDATTRQLVALDRFNKVDYAVQRGRLTALYERFRPVQIIAELNSIGQPVVEQLQRDGLPVQGFMTTNATKATAIDALALAFERGDIAILDDPVLVGELQAYEMQPLPSGLRRYSAPDGMHDDTVMSLAMAWQGVGRGGPLVLF